MSNNVEFASESLSIYKLSIHVVVQAEQKKKFIEKNKYMKKF